MIDIVEILDVEKVDGYVISHARNRDGRFIEQRFPILLENGQPNPKADKLFEIAMDRIAKQKAQANVQQAPIQQPQPVQLVQQVQTNNTLQRSYKLDSDGLVSSELLVAIQYLNPDVDIIVDYARSRNDYNHQTGAYRSIGMSIKDVSEVEKLNLPEGSEAWFDNKGVIYAQGMNQHLGYRVPIMVSPIIKDTDGKEKYTWWENYHQSSSNDIREGIRFPKDIKDLSMCTDLNEVVEELRKLNPLDIFVLDGEKIITTLDESAYQNPVYPLGFKDKTGTNKAGLKINFEYVRELDDALASKDEFFFNGFKELIRRRRYPEESEKQEVYNKAMSALNKKKNVMSSGMTI